MFVEELHFRVYILAAHKQRYGMYIKYLKKRFVSGNNILKYIIKNISRIARTAFLKSQITQNIFKDSSLRRCSRSVDI